MPANTKFQEPQDAHADQDLQSGRLSTTQLVLRRGLTMFAAAGLLATGAGVHILVPLPETPPSNLTVDWINSTDNPDHMFSSLLAALEDMA